MKQNKLAVSKTTIKQLEDEIQQEYIDSLKTEVKDLMKEIRMTEIILEKQKIKLKAYLDGSVEVTEEELLFNR